MEIKLHYMPEKPDHSCMVVVFHINEYKEIFNVTNVYYSEKYGLFNCHDFLLADEAEKSVSYTESVYAWAYMDDVNAAVLKGAEDA